jgi:tetratricopeptide (TPR) repeat protein
MRYSQRVSTSLTLFFVVLLAGCATGRLPAVDTAALAGIEELVATPFYPQEEYQCGPAALLTILTTSGVETDMDTLVRQVYLPGRQGSLQAELLAATRAADRIAYPIDGRLEALAAELRAGRPVLVLQNLGVSWIPRWHYAVVVGLDAEREELVLRSGIDERRLTKLRTFLHTWRRGGYWGFVALRADELPADVEQTRWLGAVAATEQVGRLETARQAWTNAVATWPESIVARYGLATNAFKRGDWQAAERVYRNLLLAEPELAVARNNLALALLRQQRHAEAQQEAERALSELAADSPLREEVLRTLTEIREAG